MSKYGKPYEKKEGPNPFLPIVGFILLVGFGGFSYVIAPNVRHFLETTRYRLATLQVLPMTFPDWPDNAVNGVVAFIIFLIFFSIAMVVALILIPSKRTEDAAGEWLEADQKERKKRRGY